MISGLPGIRGFYQGQGRLFLVGTYWLYVLRGAYGSYAGSFETSSSKPKPASQWPKGIAMSL